MHWLYFLYDIYYMPIHVHVYNDELYDSKLIKNLNLNLIYTKR